MKVAQAQKEDAATLSAAMEREYETAFFYRSVLGGSALGPSAALVQTIANDHDAHRAFLADAVSNAGGTVPPAKEAYPLPLGLRDDAAVVRAAIDAEEAGLQAGLRDVSVLILPQHREGVAAIVAVQAQHVSLLRLTQGLDPVPRAFLGDGLS